jgi:hypothetical protein
MQHLKNIFTGTILGAAAALALTACIHDPEEIPNPPGGDPRAVTFVVSAPPADNAVGARTRAARAGNAHFPEGVPADYRNYNADADTQKYGHAFGGYPDAETETAAFENTVAEITANQAKSPSAKSGRGAGERESENGKPGANPATRAIAEGSEADNHIEEIAILLFDEDGAHLETKYIGGGTGADAVLEATGDAQRWKFTLKDMPDGKYKALFIANSRAAIDAYIAAGANLTIGGFREGLLVRGQWNHEPGSTGYRHFPMSSKEESFTIPAYRDYTLQPIELVRALAKINVTTSISDFEIQAVAVLNTNTNGRIVPSEEWRRGLGLDQMGGRINDESGMATNIDFGSVMSSNAAYPADGNKLIDRVFIYEKKAITSGGSYAHNNLCLIVAAKRPGVFPDENGGVRYFRISPTIPDADGKQVPINVVRNYSYDIDIADCNTIGYASVEEAYYHPDELETTIVASDQGEIGDYTYNGEYQLATDRSVVVIGSSIAPSVFFDAKLKVATDYDQGWSITPTSLDNGNISISPVGGTGDVSEVTLHFNVETRPDHVVKHTFRIIAGELHKDITVIQVPRASEVADVAKSDIITSYAGAFWRAEQTGERLIAIKPNVKWSAFALDAPADGVHDWVVMDAKPSKDDGVGGSPEDDGNDSGFDRKHAVNSTVGWAQGETGSNVGYLRLGARNAFAPTPVNPSARYATVLMVPGSVEDGDLSADPNEYRLLYLRQGHEADYLFSGRENSVRFSPYNLTAPEDKNLAGAPGGGVEIGYRGGVFADYPTQAGAFFRGTGPKVLYAYHPTKAVDTSVWGELNVNDPSFEPHEDETCPPGYRRPIGTIGSEMTHSLWLDPTEDSRILTINHSTRGYYADGFFDRREPSGQGNSTPGPAEDSAVATGTGDVAYAGELLFNDSTGASIFFPSAGYRDSNGNLAFTGHVGSSWSSSFDNFDQADGSIKGYRFDSWTTSVQPDGYGHRTGHGWYPDDAASVRCVANPDYTPEPGLVQAPPGVIGIRHSELSKPIGQRSLTLRGSSTYKGTWVERIATNDPNLVHLEDEPVYMVYFKWGSTVAMLGDEQDDAGYDPADVVWVNPGNSTTGYNTYSSIIAATPETGGVYHIPDNPSAGFGDPCDWVNGGTNTALSGWKTPAGNPWTYHDGEVPSTPFGSGGADLEWNTGSVDARWFPASGRIPAGGVSNDGMIFLPAGGARSIDNQNQTVAVGFYGLYWSSTNNESLLLFEESVKRGNMTLDQGMPVRCVRNKPIENVLITGDVDGTPIDITRPTELTIGNTAKIVTLTKGTTLPTDASDPVQWHWEYSIGSDETSWIVVPNSQDKETLVTSTHDDHPDNEFAMVGGTNRFRIVAYNLSGTVRSEVISITLKLPTLTYAVIGSGAWSWAAPARVKALSDAITQPGGVLNAGNPNAIIKTEGLTELWRTSTLTGTNGATNLLKYGKIRGTVTSPIAGNATNQGEMPDIVLYFCYGAAPTDELSVVLSDFVNNKGALIFSTNDNWYTQTTTLLNRIFPGEGLTAYAKTNFVGDDNIYRINDLPNDPIVNGPFGYLGRQSNGNYCYVGESNYGGYTVYVPELPEGAVQIASLNTPRREQPPEYSFVWYSARKNFFYIGDSAEAITAGSLTDPNRNSHTVDNPAVYLTGTGMPLPRVYGYYTTSAANTSTMTYNAVLEMNALAWAMTRAARSGINPH